LATSKLPVVSGADITDLLDAMNDPSAEQLSPLCGDLRKSPEAEAVVPDENGPMGGECGVQGDIHARVDPAHAPQNRSSPHGSRVLGDVSGDAVIPQEHEGAPPPSSGRDDEVEDPKSPPVASLLERWRRHAQELAEHLRHRQRDLDHREARLHSEAARLEHEDRLLRLLWSQKLEDWEEKRLELARREAELDHRDSALRRREEELEGRLEALRVREEVLNQREYQIGLGEAELAKRRKEWEDRVRAFENHQQDLESLAAILVPSDEATPSASQAVEDGPGRSEREWADRPEAAEPLITVSFPADRESCERRAGSPAVVEVLVPRAVAEPRSEGDCRDRGRERALAEVEAQANQLRHRAEDLLRELEEDRDKLRQESRDVRSRWSMLERQLLDDWTARSRILLQREEELRTAAARNQTLLHTAETLHRQALEHRTAMETLWARMSGKIPRAELRRRVMKLRRKLAATYRRQMALAEQKLAECQRLRAETAALQETLTAQWQAQNAALEERRKELLAESRHLTGREQEFRFAERDWLLEKRKYETVELRLLTEIHRLRERLREALSMPGETPPSHA